MESRKQLLYS
jgi:hypothetical protein